MIQVKKCSSSHQDSRCSLIPRLILTFSLLHAETWEAGDVASTKLICYGTKAWYSQDIKYTSQFCLGKQTCKHISIAKTKDTVFQNRISPFARLYTYLHHSCMHTCNTETIFSWDYWMCVISFIYCIIQWIRSGIKYWSSSSSTRSYNTRWQDEHGYIYKYCVCFHHWLRK